MNFYKIDKNKKFYLIGIGGISMSAIAKHLIEIGCDVKGSDLKESVVTDELKKLGCKIFVGHNEENIMGNEVVVVNSAIKKDNPEFVKAMRLGLRVIDRIELLQTVANECSVSVGIAGCHGKTTATAMLANVLKVGGKKIHAHIGGSDINLNNYFYSGNDVYVGEVCEFKRNVEKFSSDIACVLNVGLDHVDCYKNVEELIDVYLNYLSRAKIKIYNSDDKRLHGNSEGYSFGIESKADFKAEKVLVNNGKPSFCIEGKRVGLNVYGRHNVYNALCAWSVARMLGLDGEIIKVGLEGFKGLKRRFEEIGSINGCPLICDYAHHPKEIEASISTAKMLTKGRLFMFFQPHTYSRTRVLMQEFIDSLSKVEDVNIFKTYGAREGYDYEGSALKLFKSLPNADRYFEEENDIKKYLRQVATKGDLVLILGAGDIYERMLKVFS